MVVGGRQSRYGWMRENVTERSCRREEKEQGEEERKLVGECFENREIGFVGEQWPKNSFILVLLGGKVWVT